MPIRVSTARLRPMFGRDPNESHRSATTLELLYDLTLVVAFGVAGTQFAHAVADGHVLAGLAAFAFVQFAAVWAWISYTWFASAFDTDDWFVRGAVIGQMIGVLILSLGIPDLFHGFEDDWHLNNQSIVLGYVVMRLSLVALYLRAAKTDPELKQTCLAMARGIGGLQVVWVTLLLMTGSVLPDMVVLALMPIAFVIEMALPYLVSTRYTALPWHAHHLAERYGLLCIIALGEGIIGTQESLQVLYEEHGWSIQVVAILAAGVCLTVGMWWLYFSVPFAQILQNYRQKVFRFSYPHIVIYAAISGVGAGLHVAAYWMEGEATLGPVGVMLTIVIPIAVFIGLSYLLAPLIMPSRSLDPFHLLLLGLTTVVLVGSVLMASAGVPFAVCLMVAMTAPWVTVIGFETIGHRHIQERFDAEAQS